MVESASSTKLLSAESLKCGVPMIGEWKAPNDGNDTLKRMCKSAQRPGSMIVPYVLKTGAVLKLNSNALHVHGLRRTGHLAISGMLSAAPIGCAWRISSEDSGHVDAAKLWPSGRVAMDRERIKKEELVSAAAHVWVCIFDSEQSCYAARKLIDPIQLIALRVDFQMAQVIVLDERSLMIINPLFTTSVLELEMWPQHVHLALICNL